ncbi:MAG: nucleoid-associated protein [Nitrososphaerota archaeon]
MDTLERAGASRVIERNRRGKALRVPDAVAATQPAATPVAAPGVSVPAITIERLILHHLDNRAGEMLLVEAELSLDTSIRTLFASYIAEATKNADWQARFLTNQPGTPTAPAMPDLCASLLEDPAAFVAVSQQMARRLYEQMLQRPNQINPGDFVAAIYRASGAATSCIALFKLDPDARLVRDFSTERGRRLVRISLADNLMPQTVRLKQKCALITPSTDGADFSVMLLDTLANIHSEGVAVYFYKGFLGAQILPSARRRTRLFLRASDDWLADHSAALSPRALMRFYAARRAALAGETIDLPTFTTAALPEDSNLVDDLLAALIPKIFDAEFEPHQTRFTVDRATADPIVQYVTLEMDGGARLRIPAQRFDDLASVADRRVGGKFSLTIETLTLKEVTTT